MATAKKNDSLVQYEDFSLDDVEEQEKEAKETAGAGVIFKIPPGKTVVRAVPAKPGEKLMMVAYVHYLDVPGVGKVSFNCPRLMAKRNCTVCKKEAELLSTGEDIDFKKSKKLKAKRQLYMPIIVRGEEEAGVRILRFGKMIEDQLIEIRKDEDDGGNFAHPVEGFDLKISRKGEGEFDTEYKVTKTGDVKPLSNDAAEMKDWIENQPQRERFLRVLSDEDIEAKLAGEGGGRGRGDRERGEKPAQSSRKPKRTVDEEIEDAEIVLED